ncbi:MAG: methyl-accepting chemotaxis protein [Steroidobacteraceae bacterium]|jgi:methyl-accepting chemotaxis protein
MDGKSKTTNVKRSHWWSRIEGAGTAASATKVAALEALAASVMLADNDLNITYMNAGVTALLTEAEAELRKAIPGFSVASLIGRNIDAFHKNPSHQRAMLERLSTVHRATIKIGTRAFDLIATPMFDARGKRVGTIVEWMSAEARLLNLDYSAQIAAIGRSQAVIEFALDGTILTANDNLLKSIGYSLAEISGQPHRLLVEPAYAQSPEYRDFWEKLRSGQYITGQHKRIGKGGREIWLQASYNPILDANGKPLKIVKYATDVTDQVRTVEDVGHLVQAAIDGDLTKRIDTQGRSGNLLALSESVNLLIEAMMAMVAQMRSAIGAVRTGADEIAKGNSNLSERTEQQAASLEETASSMEEMTSSVKQSADNASNASHLASAARTKAEAGANVVSEAIAAMGSINDASGKIADIIGVIDEIAFQTNLLALNAAVEAARAGEQGRGFAVVASEVRNLASRSAAAAKEIKTLIQDSVAKVAQGSKLVDQSGKTLSEIVVAVKKATDIVAEIAAASGEQAAGIEQVNRSVMSMDEVTQQNAALVEESAAAAESLLEEAGRLDEMMSKYQVLLNATAAAPRPPELQLEKCVETSQDPHARRATSRPVSGSKTHDGPATRRKPAAPSPKVVRMDTGSAKAIWSDF